jgi:uncharacterized membrane protein YraQ (UPF0718 family)
MPEIMNGTCNAAAVNPPWGRELKVLAGFAALFLVLFFLPVGMPRFDNALKEGLELTKWYAQEHVLLCLIPALFIAGGISTFVNQASVMRYLGPKANKAMAYGVASVSGTILAVCSCTVLPLFGGIWMRGAGLGPATAFLYSGPAINVLAIVMTARILGMELGVARVIGAVGSASFVGMGMHFVFRREEQAKAKAAIEMPEVEVKRPLWQNVLFFASMVGVLVFANWSKPAESTGLWASIHAWKWPVAGAFAAGLGAALGLWFDFKWKELALVAAPVVVMKLRLRPRTADPVHRGLRRPGGALRPESGRRPRVAGRDLDADEADLPVADRRRVCFGHAARSAGTRSPDSFGLGQPVRRRQFRFGQFLFLDRGRLHVFRHADGSSHSAGAHRLRHGERTGAGAVAGRSGAFVAQHAGAPQHHGHEKAPGRLWRWSW